MSKFLLITMSALMLCLAACSSPDFDPKPLLENTPVDLTNEQVTLTDAQVNCGAQNELWDPPSGNIAKLTQKGRDLKFTDDVRVVDPNIHVPYTQVSGKFSVQVAEIAKVRDVEGGKLVDARLGVIIPQDCFNGTSLPLMGVRKGNFAPDAPVVFRFVGSGKEWSLDKLMH